MVRIVRSALTLFEVEEQTTRSPCLLAAHSLAFFYPVANGSTQWFLVIMGRLSLKFDLVRFVTAHTLSSGQ